MPRVAVVLDAAVQRLPPQSDGWRLLRTIVHYLRVGRARGLQPLATLTISILAGVFLARTFDLTSALRNAGTVHPLALLMASLALGAGLLLSSLRYHRVLDALGLGIPFRLAVRANLIGIVGGVLFFQLLGQTLARTAVLSRSGVNSSAVLLANVYERIAALFSLSVMAICAGVYLYGSVSINLVGGGYGLLKFVMALAAVTCASLFVVRRRLIWFALSDLVRGPSFQALSGVGFYSLLMHLSTLIAFVVVGRMIVPHVEIASLAAASLIVMFAASIPISFAGWGIREISAVYAYGSIGIEPDAALAISILVGFLGLALVLAAGWLSHATRSDTSLIAVPIASSAAIRRSSQIERSLSWLVPILAAILVLFQVHLPVNGGTVNVNLADPVAIAGGLIFLARYVSMRQGRLAWRIEHFEIMLLVTTIALACALVNGAARFGYSDWAFFNRFIGWFVLLGYLGTGALVITAGPISGLKLILKLMLGAGVAIALVDLVLLAAVQYGGALMHEWFPLLRITGMAQNANAFALQLSILIGIFCAMGGRLKSSTSSAPSLIEFIVLTTLILALLCSSSRTGYLTGAAVLITATALRWVNLRLVVTASLVAVVISLSPNLLVLGTGLMHQLMHALGLDHLSTALGTPGAVDSAWQLLRIEQDNSVKERWYSIVRGFELWTEHPVFGNGLGAFVETVKAEKGIFLVIHNTSLWILAEFGVVGFALLASVFGSMVYASWSHAIEGQLWARVLILVLLCFAFFQMTHEIFYQRIFWFLFGATLFAVPWQHCHRQARETL